MQKTDNYNSRKRKGLRNKKWTIFWLLQPVLPDWSQLLIYQEFTRAFLCIYDKVLNKKWGLKKRLLGLLQPVLPNWLQLLIYQYFTRTFLYIYDEMANKIWGSPLQSHFLFLPSFFKVGYNPCRSMFIISAHTGKYRKKERPLSRHFGCCNPFYQTVIILILSANYTGLHYIYHK